jgi:dihydroorotate dehydrogenase
VPRKAFVEITTSVHSNDYLRRHLLHQRGGSFGVKGIHREGKAIVSKPHVFSGNENAKDLAEQILERLNAKTIKAYPSGTVLIVNCITNLPILEDEWTDAVEQVRKAAPGVKFREVFLMDMLMSHTTTLYGDQLQ